MRLPGPENAVLAYIANAKHKAAVICKPAKADQKEKDRA